MITDFEYTPDENGLFPATTADNPEMNQYWIRDNYWIWRSGFYTEEIEQAFRKIVNKHEDKIKYHIENHPPEETWQHIHVKYDENLEEVTGNWAHDQLDTIGYLMDVLGHSREGHLVKHYFDNVGIFPGHGPWESGKTVKYHPYCIMKMRESLRKWYGQDKPVTKYLYRLSNRKYIKYRDDLELLMMQTVNSENPILWQDPTAELTTQFGVKRFEGDEWNGEEHAAKTEPAWPLGLAFKYVVTEDEKYMRQLDKIHKRYGEIPELINPKTTAPGINSPLIWAEAMYHGLKENLFKKDL